MNNQDNDADHVARPREWEEILLEDPGVNVAHVAWLNEQRPIYWYTVRITLCSGEEIKKFSVRAFDAIAAIAKGSLMMNFLRGDRYRITDIRVDASLADYTPIDFTCEDCGLRDPEIYELQTQSADIEALLCEDCVRSA